MLDNYEKFKKDVYALTKIDLNCYKEKQMRRRIDTLINKNGITSYDAYVDLIKKDKEKFEQFVIYHRPQLLQVDAVDLPPAVQARPCL